MITRTFATCPDHGKYCEQVGCVPCKVGTVTTPCCGVKFVRGSSFTCGCSLEKIVGAYKTGSAPYETQAVRP